MAACDDRQLTEAERQAAYQQQRTGVTRALRPFSGSPTIENLLDYINRELVPAVRSGRDAVNDIYLQVADQAPSANPLHYFFAESVVDADPTSGRIRLNQAVQNTATVIRISELNAQLETAFPWLDVMAGSATLPIGVVTLVDARDPGRFVRWDLETMVDMGTYWNLAVTPLESSHPNPFVEGEAVTLGFIPGVASLTGGGAKPILPPPMFLPRRTDSDERRALIVPGPPGLQGAQGVPGPAGREGDDGRRGLPGMPGAAGAPGLTGLTGSSGRDGEDGRNGRAGAAGTAGVAGIMGLRGRDGEDGRRARPTTPTTSVIASTVPTVNAGQQLGRQIDSAAAGAAPIALSGAEQGENIRFGTTQATSVTGTQNDFALADDTTELTSAGATVTFTGFVRNSVAATGKPFLFRVGSGVVATLAHNTGSSANNQITCPGDVDLVLTSRAAVWLVESSNKWRVISMPNAGRLIAFTEYTSGSGTHTFDPATTFVVRDLVGGGGPGGSILNAAGSDSGASGGGQSGEYQRFAAAPGGATEAYSVGSGGTAAAGAAGADGGNTTMGAFTATGGKAAALCTTALTAGVSDGGFDIASPRGQPGTPGWWDAFAVGTSRTVPGIGGSNAFGNGGCRASAIGAGSANGVSPGNGFGGGGSGARTQGTAGDCSGGTGRDGYIVVWEYS